MIHLTYFRYLREDKINLAPEVSIYSSLSVENLPHCKQVSEVGYSESSSSCKDQLPWKIPCYYLILLSTNTASL